MPNTKLVFVTCSLLTRVISGLTGCGSDDSKTPVTQPVDPAKTSVSTDMIEQTSDSADQQARDAKAAADEAMKEAQVKAKKLRPPVKKLSKKP